LSPWGIGPPSPGTILVLKMCTLQTLSSYLPTRPQRPTVEARGVLQNICPRAKGQQFTLKRKSKTGFLLPLLFSGLLPEEVVRTVSSPLLPLPGRGFALTPDRTAHTPAAVLRAGVSVTDEEGSATVGTRQEGRLHPSPLSAGTSLSRTLSLQAWAGSGCFWYLAPTAVCPE